jgi:hypothetical protein
MWVITYHVIPKPNTPAFDECGGAYVDCWILYAWEDGAEYLARYEVEKEWTIVEREGMSWLESDDVPVGDEDREYFDQVLIDGGTFVYNMYPLQATEEDEDFEIENSTVSTDTKLKSDH